MSLSFKGKNEQRIPTIQDRLKLLGLTSLFLAPGALYAINPVQGWYGGILLGVSYSPKMNIAVSPPLLGLPTTANLSYSVFGDIAGEVGYRFCQYRAELELLFNNNPYNQLRYDTFTISSPKTSTDLRMKGQTNTGAVMVNGFYDFLTFGGTTSFVPYLGLGVGYAYISNTAKFYFDNTLIPNTNYSKTSSAPAAQGIIGLSYFLDDYTAFGLDYRYFSTKTVSPFTSRQVINSINIGFSGAFDNGG